MTTTTRRAIKAGARRELTIVAQRGKTKRELCDLENQICDLDRAARIAFLMAMHDSENEDEEPLGLYAVEQVERLASELRAAFDRAVSVDQVRS